MDEDPTLSADDGRVARRQRNEAAAVRACLAVMRAGVMSALDDAAALAGVSPRSVHRRFGGWDGLVQAALSERGLTKADVETALTEALHLLLGDGTSARPGTSPAHDRLPDVLAEGAKVTWVDVTDESMVGRVVTPGAWVEWPTGQRSFVQLSHLRLVPASDPTGPGVI